MLAMKKYDVLLIDAGHSVSSKTQVALESEGFSVMVVGDGDEAKDWLAREDFTHLVLVAPLMGRECASIKKWSERLPIVAMHDGMESGLEFCHCIIPISEGAKRLRAAMNKASERYQAEKDGFSIAA
jgi:CheY-like chemotaxis protein